MGKGGPTVVDIANLGVDLYQTRQIKKMHLDMEEATTTIQIQMLQMQMAQEEEAKKKSLIIESRKLVLEIENEIGRIRRAFLKYPAHSSLTFDMLYHMIEESPLNTDLFEEFVDIERSRAMEHNVVETKAWIDSRTTPSIVDIKQKILRYSTEEPDLVAAIEMAAEREDWQSQREQTQTNIVDLQAKWEGARPEWEEKQAEIEVRKGKLSQTAKFSILSGVGLAIALISLSALFLRVPEAELETYVSYILYASWGYPLLMWLNLSANPIIPKNDPLILLRDSIASQEIQLSELDEMLADSPPAFDDRSTSAELTQLKVEWLDFVDKNSPRPNEFFEDPLKAATSTSKFTAGPPRVPAASLSGDEVGEGQEWIEYPPTSDRWFYRQSKGEDWIRWRS